MKLIKINDDMYINAAIIQGIVINEIDGSFWVQAGVDSPDPINLAPFETRNEARQYLDKLVAELNGEDND